MNTEPDYILPTINGFGHKILDYYLAQGYYRTQHILFTTNITRLDFGSTEVPVFWLRNLVKHLLPQHSANIILKKCHHFKVVYKFATINHEIEALYQKYRDQMKFSTALTVYDYLHQIGNNPFDSKMIEIRHNQQLIAVGYFDEGENSIAGILNFYDPNYAKYSLGKLLILKKIAYAQAQNITYYYTGYISTVSPKFDYKIFPSINAVEVYLPIEKIWVPYSIFNKQALAEYYAKYLQ
jgi:leucyl-tRNA---protein transferase